MHDEPQQPGQPANQQKQQRKAARDAARSVTAAKSSAQSKSKPTTKPPTKPARQSAKQPAIPPAMPPDMTTGTVKVMSAVDPASFNPHMMERQMAAMTRLLEQQDFQTDEEAQAFLDQINAQGGPIIAPPTTPLEQAQDLIAEAWGLSGRRRDKLIRQALDLSPDCADAYVLMAESTNDPQKARDYYEQGMRVGERAIGPEMFTQIAADGEFWRTIETRPYMRARQGLATVLWLLGERAAATEHMLAMLRLNPNDNQGLRYMLASWLLIAGDDLALKRATDLLKQFAEDDSAFMAYSRLLLTLRTKGPGAAADQALRAAMQTNPFVPFYLLGLLPLPKQPPEYYGFGDQDEAITYLVEGGGEAWAAREDDIEWLVEALVRLAPPGLNEQFQPGPERHHKRPRKHK